MRRVLASRRDGPATLDTFYAALCRQHAANMASYSRGNFAALGLEWPHDYYGVRRFQTYDGWLAVPGHEVGPALT